MSAIAAALFTLLFVAVGAIGGMIWILFTKIREMRTDYGNSLMILEATEKSLRENIQEVGSVNAARLEEVTSLYRDVEAKLIDITVPKKAEEPIRQFRGAADFRKFIESANQ